MQSLFFCIYQCHLKVVFWLWLPGFTCLVQQCRPVWRRPCCLLHLVQALGQAAHSGPDCASVATSTNNSRCYTTKSNLSSKWQTVMIASVLALSLVFMSCFSFNLVHGGLVVLNVHQVKVNQEQSISSILIFTGKQNQHKIRCYWPELRILIFENWMVKVLMICTFLNDSTDRTHDFVIFVTMALNHISVIKRLLLFSICSKFLMISWERK